MTVNSIRRDLSTAASRADIVDRRGASDKQVAFLASLLDRCGDTADDVGYSCTQTNAILTSKACSHLIEDYLEQAKRTPPPAAPAPTTITVSLKPIVEFLHAAGANLKWPKVSFADPDLKLTKAGPRAKVPGSVNVADSGPYGDNTWYGRINVDGTFEPSRAITPEVETFLTDLAANPEEVIRAHGHRSGHCSFCSKALTTDASLKAGYGPTCAQSYGLPHG
jgi:hypothetical protein